LDFSDVSSVFSEVMKSETVRAPMSDDYDVAILGTAEARMQTADVVILMGLNDGMFPSDGFRHSWLPRNIARKIGLPDSDSKVSLMALDFMTLSCGKNVYWTRSKMSGGSKTTQSRFLSRVGVRVKVNQGTEILAAVRAADEAPFAPLDSSPPVVKYSGDYHATWLESLTHNPYLFYARHILHLRKRPDIGESMGAKEFGTLVHDVLERAETDGIKTVPELILMLEEAALNYIGRENILFRFWRNRFREFAPVVSEMMKKTAVVEKTIRMKYKGRNLIAKADRIEDGARVIDYKTGNVPSNEQLGLGKAEFCAMPQLPIEAMIMRENAPDVSMAFLRLQKNHVGMIDYDCEKTARAIEAVKKTLEIAFNTTVYARPDHHLDDKYTDFDDLCRYGD
jgi:ATP-dependent helicase/nuclease subunit B